MLFREIVKSPGRNLSVALIHTRGYTKHGVPTRADQTQRGFNLNRVQLNVTVLPTRPRMLLCSEI